MSLIIAATDFSDIGTNAINYACSMAQEQSSDLMILHSYSVPLMFSDGPMPVNFVNDTQHDAEEQMSKLLINLYQAYPAINIKGEVVYGDIIDTIEDYVAKNEKPWMIIVGNSTTSEGGTWPGSTMIEAFNSLKYPVMAIPPAMVYKSIKNICFAFDNKHSGNISAMLRLADIKQKLNAELHVLNVQTDGSNTNDTEIDPIVRNLLSPTDPDYTIIIDTDVNGAIEKFVQQNNSDLLIMIPRRHSFFEGLFHRSHTKAVAHVTHIPVLALHDSQV